jgi:hypothetical protein
VPCIARISAEFAPRSVVPIVEPTEELLRRVRQGDNEARQSLYDRTLPLLRRWAHGRLAHSARDINDVSWNLIART